MFTFMMDESIWFCYEILLTTTEINSGDILLSKNRDRTREIYKLVTSSANVACGSVQYHASISPLCNPTWINVQAFGLAV